MRILISGSLAYDKIFDYPGQFKKHIDPKKAHVISLSFAVKNQQTSIGGTAANIAFSMAQLDLRTEVIGAVGDDGQKIIEKLQSLKVGTGYIKTARNKQTATAYIISDLDDNQIAAFYEGAMMTKAELPKLEPCDWPLIAAEDPGNMARLASHYQKTKHRYIFDPGQQIIALSKKQLQICVRGASVVFVNDYELSLLLKKLGRKKLKAVIFNTLGRRGSEIIFPNGQKAKIGIAKPRREMDPTGAGDAYRAGAVKGIVSGFDLKISAQLGASAASFAIEQFGTQKHKFNYDILKKRHNKNFKSRL